MQTLAAAAHFIDQLDLVVVALSTLTLNGFNLLGLLILLARRIPTLAQAVRDIRRKP